MPSAGFLNTGYIGVPLIVSIQSPGLDATQFSSLVEAKLLDFVSRRLR